MPVMCGSACVTDIITVVSTWSCVSCSIMTHGYKSLPSCVVKAEQLTKQFNSIYTGMCCVALYYFISVVLVGFRNYR